MKLNGAHWTLRDYKQRMTAKEWKKALLNEEDRMIYHGHCVRLVAKNLGYGVVEVSKEFPNATKQEGGRGVNYILEGKKAVECDDIHEWGRWLKTAERHVADTTKDGIRVSTVFLGIDYGFTEEGPPILFETMVFGHDGEEICERYSTWEEAERGHEEVCKKALPTTSKDEGRGK